MHDKWPAKAFKLSGRVGVIGAGLFADGEFGAVVYTGLGEGGRPAHMAAFSTVEAMRDGASLQQVCEVAVRLGE